MMRRALIPVLPALAVLLALAAAGCRTTIGEDGGPDMPFLRVPAPEGDAKPALDTATPLSLLFPVGAQRRWEMLVSVGENRMTEQIRIGAPRRVGGVSGAVTLEMRKNGGGAVYREESYLVGRRSIQLVAAGGDDKMVMSPPMPLIDMDAPEGGERKWRGTITFKGAEAQASAVTRLGAREKVTTPAGTFDAYRVDTSLTTIIEGRPVTFPASRWFSPGVGIVRQRFRVGRAEVVKELTAFRAE